MNPKNLTVREATEEASNEHITANELDILVSKTREINRKRDRDIEQLETMHHAFEESYES